MPDLETLAKELYGALKPKVAWEYVPLEKRDPFYRMAARALEVFGTVEALKSAATAIGL